MRQPTAGCLQNCSSATIVRCTRFSNKVRAYSLPRLSRPSIQRNDPVGNDDTASKVSWYPPRSRSGVTSLTVVCEVAMTLQLPMPVKAQQSI